MGIDFDINVNLHTTGKDQVDALEKQIEKLKNSSIKLNVDLSGDGADIAKYFTNIQKQAQTAGKGIGTSLQQGIKSVKFNGNSETFIKQYLEQIKKDTKEAESVAKKFDVSQKDALKAVNARNSAEIKANNEAIKEQKRQQKEIEAIESSRIKSIENAKKREEKATLAQNKAINKSLEESYKKQQQEQQKLNAQNLAQIRTAEESQKRIQVQQKISEMKASASQQNKHNNDLVQQGKDNIAKWKVQYQQQQKEIEAIESSRIKASENAKKREEKLIQNQNNAINKSLENDYKQQQKNIEQKQQLISKQTELLDKNKKTLSSSLSNNTYANAKDIKEAKDLLQLMNTTDLNKYNEPAKRVQEIASQVSKVTSKLSETHKLNLDNLNKEIAAEEKANIQNLKYIQQGEESQKRIQVQQQIAAMKANAVQKNAHYNSLVQQGKDNIIKWEQQYKEQNNYAEKLEATQKRIATLQTNSKADSFKGMYGDTAKYKDIENNLSKIEQLQSRINSEMAKGSSKDTSKINSDLKEMTSHLSKAENAFNNLTKPIGVLDASIASNKTLSWLKENSKAAKQLGTAFEELAERQKRATTAGELENYNKQYNSLVSLAQSKGLTGKSALQEFGRAFKQIGQFAWTYGLIQQIPDAISKSVTELKEINTIVTEISKAADVPVKQIKELETSSFSVASKYGQKASDYLLGVQEMTRAGYSDTSGMAELSTLAQSAGDMTAELANQYLIASDMAFGYGGNVEKLNALLDSQNQITNRNAVSLTELANATKIVASQAAQSGVSEDKMTAALSTMIATTQQGGEIAARAFKGILMNLQQVTGELEDGEVIDEDSLKKVEKRLTGVGVAMKEVKDGTVLLRDPMQVLEELAQVYNSLPDNSVEKAGIISDLGGKYRGNQLAALLANWDKYKKILGDYQNAEGSAAQEAEKTAQSWEGSLNRLSNTWTDLIQNIVDSTSTTNIINFINGIVSGVDTLTEKLGGFKSFLSIVAGGFLTKNGLGKRNAILYKIKQNNRRFINVENFLASNKNKPYSFNY